MAILNDGKPIDFGKFICEVPLDNTLNSKFAASWEWTGQITLADPLKMSGTATLPIKIDVGEIITFTQFKDTDAPIITKLTVIERERNRRFAERWDYKLKE